VKKEIYIDGYNVEYEILEKVDPKFLDKTSEEETEIPEGYYLAKLTQIRFYNSEGPGSKPLNALTYRLKDETDADLVTRVFNDIRMC